MVRTSGFHPENPGFESQWGHSKMSKDPKNQSVEEIVASLLINDKRQYTESAHAEIFRRLIATIENFNKKAEKVEKLMLLLAGAQVILATAQILLALK